MFKRDPKRDRTGFLWEHAQTFRRSDPKDPGMFYRVAVVGAIVFILLLGAAMMIVK